MTSPSSYHYVESSSRLLDNEEEETVSLEETLTDQLAPQANHTPHSVGFYQDEILSDQQQYEENRALYQNKRNRTTSLCKNEADTNRKRRTSSFNENKLPHLQVPSLNPHHNVTNRHTSHADNMNIKSSFKKILNAGKQIVPAFQHSISVHSVKKPSAPNTPSVHSFKYNRSQSYNQHHNEEDNSSINLSELNAHTVTGGQYDSYLRQKDSKLNFLSRSFDEQGSGNHLLNHFKQNMHHNQLHTPASVAEESLSTGSSSSTSQSSTPSSSLSKNNRLNMESEEHYSLLAADDRAREKLFIDSNNNLVKDSTGELVRMGGLTFTRTKSDSVRMRNYSSNANDSVHRRPQDLLVEAIGSNSGLLDNNGLESPSSSSDDGSQTAFKNVKENRRSYRTCFSNYFVISLMFMLNLLNYIDRYTLAGVLKEVQEFFNIGDGEAGLLQTVFIGSYMLLAPLFGYLGDRYPRKWLIVFGITFWSAMTLLGSFVPADKFWLFALIRGMVGIGEASYSCVAPTIIGDLFTTETRTRMLAIFYLAVPVGSGMGYIFGSKIAQLTGNWQWALRATPTLGAVCIVLLVFFVREPKRGGAEGSKQDTNKSSVMEDLIYLCKNRTFIWVTLGFTFATFVLGGLSWWVPLYVTYAIESKNETPEGIPVLFGVVTCISGLFGVVVSSLISPGLRKLTGKADPLLCAFGSLITVPCLFILILVTRSIPMPIWWCLTFVAISAMCLSWTIVADILLYTIHPTKRSIASAFNILICHLFGDAFSPYVIGAISDSLRAGKPDTFFNRFESLQFALYAGPVFALLSFAAYLFAAIYVEEDKKKVELIIKKNQKCLTDPAADKSSDTNINAHMNREFSSQVNDVNENNTTASRGNST